MGADGWTRLEAKSSQLAAWLTKVKSPAGGASVESGQRPQPTPQPGRTRLTDDLVASGLRRLDRALRTDVVGRATYESAKTYGVVLLSATFLGPEGEIVGTASGSVDLPPGGSPKSFRLSSVGVVRDVDSFEVQSTVRCESSRYCSATAGPGHATPHGPGLHDRGRERPPKSAAGP